MTGQLDVPHGRGGYRRGCDCPTCRTGVNAYNRYRRRVKFTITATKVAAHIQTLTRAGVSWKRIAEAADVSLSLVERIVREPNRRVWARTAQAILDANPTPWEINPIGAHRRIQALTCLGWSLSAIARQLGCTPQNIHQLLNATRITQATHDTIAALYNQLCMTPAPPNWTANAARAMARSRGWAPPLAWDDIDDPDEQPHGMRTEPK